MKYFTKYIPVEGEIKDNDLVLCKYRNKLGHITYPDNADGMYWINYLDGTEGSTDHFDLVKLFLCSRDIHVGDELTWIGDGKDPVETPFGGKIKHDTPLTSGIIHENWIKVIGEVSPYAIWVKEGDEFWESEVQGVHEMKWPKGHFKYHKDEFVCYTIKGPCGHFH